MRQAGFEKIELLKCIEAGEIDPTEITNDAFVIERAEDGFSLLMANASRRKEGLSPAIGISLTPDHRAMLKANFNELFETVPQRNQPEQNPGNYW